LLKQRFERLALGRSHHSELCDFAAPSFQAAREFGLPVAAMILPEA
jgi:hypothetical protein